MNHADTNWLESLYITPDPNDPEAVSRRGTVERFMRKQAGQLATSHVVLLEARNVFSRTTGEKHPREISGNSSALGGSAGLLAHFGLGDATNVDLVRIQWPSGLVQEFHDVAANQSLKITEHQEGVTNVPSMTASRLASDTVQLTLTGQTNLQIALLAPRPLCALCVLSWRFFYFSPPAAPWPACATWT